MAIEQARDQEFSYENPEAEIDFSWTKEIMENMDKETSYISENQRKEKEYINDIRYKDQSIYVKNGEKINAVNQMLTDYILSLTPEYLGWENKELEKFQKKIAEWKYHIDMWLNPLASEPNFRISRQSTLDVDATGAPIIIKEKPNKQDSSLSIIINPKDETKETFSYIKIWEEEINYADPTWKALLNVLSENTKENNENA